MDLYADEFDGILKSVAVFPDHIYIHPKIWGGYWSIKNYPKWIKVICRYVGRKLHNKYIYWIGLPIYWVRGLVEYI